MQSFMLIATDEATTLRVAAQLAVILPETMVIALDGPLGAGKTTFVRGLAAACGVDTNLICSPTFVLLHQYPAIRPIYHFDAYRTGSADEFREVGCEEYFAGPGLSLVEWAERVTECLPLERLEIHLEPLDLNSRQITFRGVGPSAAAAVLSLAQWWNNRVGLRSPGS